MHFSKKNQSEYAFKQNLSVFLGLVLTSPLKILFILLFKKYPENNARKANSKCFETDFYLFFIFYKRSF